MPGGGGGNGGGGQNYFCDDGGLLASYVDSDAPGASYGGNTVNVGNFGTSEQRLFLYGQFADQRTSGDGYHLYSAHVGLWPVDVIGMGTTITVSQVTTDTWLNDLTWPTQPALGAALDSATIAEQNGYVWFDVMDWVEDNYGDEKLSFGVTAEHSTVTNTVTLYGDSAVVNYRPRLSLCWEADDVIATITPTPDGGGGGSEEGEPPPVEDYFPCQVEGSGCQDWNLRSGCGNNDLWLSFGTTSFVSAGSYVKVTNTSGAEVCRYTFPADSTLQTAKRVYLDDMAQPSGAACQSWPLQGFIATYSAGGALREKVAYDAVGKCGATCDKSGFCVTPTVAPTRYSGGSGGGAVPVRTPGPWTPQPNGAGLVMARDFNTTMTPQPGQNYSHYDIYWSPVQPNLTVTPSWNVAATRVAYVADQGMQTWLSINPFDCAWGASPDIPYVPAGVPTVAYSAGACGTEYAPNYGSAIFRDAYRRAVESLGTAFASNDDVAGVALQLGCAGETTEVYNQSASGATCPNQLELEKQVSCDKYLAWVYDAIDWWRAAFPGKVLTLATGLSACYGVADWKAIRDIAQYADARGILYRYNGIGPDAGDAYRLPASTPYPYGRYQYGPLAYSGSAFEPNILPASLSTAARVGYGDDLLFAAAGLDARFVFLQKEWFSQFDSDVTSLILDTLGTTAANSEVAWVRFRDREYGVTGPGTPNFKASGMPGPYTHLIEVVGAATPVQYCSASVRATAQAYPATPAKPCPQALTTPYAAESRNNLHYAASKTVGIDVADDWQYATGADDFDVAVTYLNVGTDTFDVAWKTGGGVQTQTVTKTNSETWQTATVALTDAILDNGLPSGGDIEIRTGTGAETLHLVTITHYAAGRARTIPLPQTVRVVKGNWPWTWAVIGVIVVILTALYLWRRARKHKRKD